MDAYALDTLKKSVGVSIKQALRQWCHQNFDWILSWNLFTITCFKVMRCSTSIVHDGQRCTESRCTCS